MTNEGPRTDDADATPEQIVAVITKDLLTEFGRVRRALDAEMVLCQIFGIVERGIEGDAAEREAGLGELLEQVVERAESEGTEDALALVRTCAVLGPLSSRFAASGAAERMVQAGVPPRRWTEAAGRPTFLRAYRYGDLHSEQESLTVLFSYEGRDHALTVLIDHQLGGGVKDVWIAEGRDATNLRSVVIAHVTPDTEVRFEDLDLPATADVLRQALACPAVPVDDDQMRDVADFSYLVQSRAEHLTALAGGS